MLPGKHSRPRGVTHAPGKPLMLMGSLSCYRGISTFEKHIFMLQYFPENVAQKNTVIYNTCYLLMHV